MPVFSYANMSPEVERAKEGRPQGIYPESDPSAIENTDGVANLSRKEQILFLDVPKPLLMSNWMLP